MAASGSTDGENEANAFHMDFSLEDGLCSDLPINLPSSKSHHSDHAHQKQQLNDNTLECNETLEDDDDSLDENPGYPPSKYLKVDLVENRLEQDKVVVEEDKEIEEEEEEINVKVELETDEEEEEAEVETNVQHKKLFEPGPSLHRSRKQNISVVRIHGNSTVATSKPREVQPMQNPRLSSAKPQSHVSSTPTIIHKTDTTTRPSILRRKTPATSTKSRGINNENLSTTTTTPNIQYKTMFRTENGKNVGYIVPIPGQVSKSSSSSVTASKLIKAPKQTKSARKDSNFKVAQKTNIKSLPTNSNVVQSGDHRKPLQSQQPNYKDDRSKYRDFIHCCKCFTTFYNFRDLVRHFERCTLPYPNPQITRSFKDYKLQQSKENQEQAEKAKETPETPVAEVDDDDAPEVEAVETILLEEGEIPTPYTKKVSLSTPSSSSTAFTNPQPKYSNYIAKTLRKYKVTRYNIPKRSWPDPNKPVCIDLDLDSPTLSSPEPHTIEDDGENNDEANHSCLECGENFKTSFSLRLHNNRHRGHVGPYKCTVEGCTRQYDDPGYLKRHERMAHPTENQLLCPFDGCSQIFVHERDLRDHQNVVHLHQAPYKCRDESCSQVFFSSRERKNHFRREHRLKKYKCPMDNCDISCKTPSTLKLHVNTHRDKRERKTAVCDYPDCGATFVNRYSVNQHKRTVHERGPRNFLCPTCGKAFYGQSNLDAHLISHSTETPHLCSFCGKAFKTPGALKSHQVIHSDETPHKCPLCEKAFKQYQGLKIHLKGHTGERSHKCHYCDKTFRQAGTRTRHEQVHTGFRPYQCKFCDDTFLEIIVVRRHVARKHPDCEFDLSNPSSYRIKKKAPEPILEQDSSSSNQ